MKIDWIKSPDNDARIVGKVYNFRFSSSIRFCSDRAAEGADPFALYLSNGSDELLVESGRDLVELRSHANDILQFLAELTRKAGRPGGDENERVGKKTEAP